MSLHECALSICFVVLSFFPIPQNLVLLFMSKFPQIHYMLASFWAAILHHQRQFNRTSADTPCAGCLKNVLTSKTFAISGGEVLLMLWTLAGPSVVV